MTAPRPSCSSCCKDMKRHTRKGSGSFATESRARKCVRKRDALMAALDRFRDVADADLAAGLRVEMWGVVDRYDDSSGALGNSISSTF